MSGQNGLIIVELLGGVEYNQNMTIIPDKEITEMELRRSTGERGTPMYVALHGIVYDVTNCPKWRTGMHEFLHFPGQDLTAEFGDAPHLEEVFLHPCVSVVGRLQGR